MFRSEILHIDEKIHLLVMLAIKPSRSSQSERRPQIEIRDLDLSISSTLFLSIVVSQSPLQNLYLLSIELVFGYSNPQQALKQ